MLIINTGDGKGKTTAAVGQAIRALGQGLAVAFGQFMKRPDQAGEQAVLSRLLGEEFLASGKGFYRRKEQYEEHREAARLLLEWARDKLEAVDMLVLDEALYALGAGLIERAELEWLVDRAEDLGRHLLLTGRGLPDWLLERADLVTAMEPVKHPFDTGQAARKGIEF